MLRAAVGSEAPDFAMDCVSTKDTAVRTVRGDDYHGRWLMLIFYPRDFTFVCPTELTAFSARYADFAERDCDILAVSVDSIELHREWLTTAAKDGGLGPLQYPLASDPEGSVARSYGVWLDEPQVSCRGCGAAGGSFTGSPSRRCVVQFAPSDCATNRSKSANSTRLPTISGVR